MSSRDGMCRGLGGSRRAEVSGAQRGGQGSGDAGEGGEDALRWPAEGFQPKGRASLEGLVAGKGQTRVAFPRSPWPWNLAEQSLGARWPAAGQADVGARVEALGGRPRPSVPQCALGPPSWERSGPLQDAPFPPGPLSLWGPHAWETRKPGDETVTTDAQAVATWRAVQSVCSRDPGSVSGTTPHLSALLTSRWLLEGRAWAAVGC